MLVTTKEKIKEKWKNEVAGTKGEEEDEEKKEMRNQLRQVRVQVSKRAASF